MGTAVQPQALRPDLRHWLEEWVDKHRGDVSAARQKADKTRIQRYLVPQLGRRSVRNLTRQTIEDWIADLQDEGVGDATIHASLLSLRATLHLCVEAGLIPDNPAVGVSVEGLQAIRQPDPEEILSETQFKALLKAIDPWYRSLVLMGARTGAEWAEAIGLHIQDVYLDKDMVTLGRQRAVEVNGHIAYREGRPGDTRLVEMSKDLAKELRTYIDETEEFRSDEYPFVFMTKRAHAHVFRANFNNFVWRPALEAAGLDPTMYTFHSLRHMAAIEMIRKGMSAEEISQALGHRHVTTTKRTYAKYFQEQASKKSRAK